jgi:hypothetical protein
MKITTTSVAGFLIIVALLIVFGPLASIWALNTLFPALAIPYNFYTWAAALILGSVLARK